MPDELLLKRHIQSERRREHGSRWLGITAAARVSHSRTTKEAAWASQLTPASRTTLRPNATHPS